MGRFIAGDPLRAISALAVFIFHALAAAALAAVAAGVPTAEIESQLGPLVDVFGHFDAGLFFFFVLSGYLIGRPFVRALVLGDRTPRLAPYLRNRFLRIVPAFWVVLTLTLLLRGTAGDSWHDLAAGYLFLDALDNSAARTFYMEQAWTLDVEVGYYVFLPLAALAFAFVVARRGVWASATPRTRAAVLLGVTAVVAVASLAVRGAIGADIDLLRSFPAMLFALMPGLALAIAEQAFRPGLAVRGRTLGPASIVLGLVLMIGAFFLPETQIVLLPALEGGGAGLIVAGLLVWQWATERAPRALDNAPLRWLGERSYSFYLVHVLAIWGARELLVELDLPVLALFAAIVAVALPVTTLVAALGYRFVERPFMGLRARPSPRREPASAAAAATAAGTPGP